MVSVGVLSGIIEMIVLVTILALTKFGDYMISVFTYRLLLKNGRCPNPNSNDLMLWNIPISIVKYRKHPLITLVLVLSIALLASELLIGFGVDASEDCQTIAKNGSIVKISKSSKEQFIPFSELCSTALQMIILKKNRPDQKLTFLSNRFPTQLNESVCFDCIKQDDQNPDDFVLKNCFVNNNFTQFEAGDVNITFTYTQRTFGTITSAFTHTNGSSWEGFGDLILERNSQLHSAFMFTSSEHKTLYFEYSNQEHLTHILTEMKNVRNEGETRTYRTAGLSLVSSIECEQNSMLPDDFERTLLTYRSIQLENVFMPVDFYNISIEDPNSNHTDRSFFETITPDDVYRSALANLANKDDVAIGTIHVYPNCAKFNWNFGVPIVITICLYAVLGITVFITQPKRSKLGKQIQRMLSSSNISRDTSPHRIRSLFSVNDDKLVTILDESGQLERLAIVSRDQLEVDDTSTVCTLSTPSTSQNGLG